MAGYRHHVSGFFTSRAEADSTLNLLLERGIAAPQLQVFAGDANAPPAPTPQAQSNSVLKDMLVNGAIGTAVGTGLGGLTTIALVAANVSLFVASPLLAPLVLLGWGASLGGLTGAMIGTSDMAVANQGRFADLIMDAIKYGDAVLVVETYSEEQTAIAREVISTAVGQYKDLNMQTPEIPG